MKSQTIKLNLLAVLGVAALALAGCSPSSPTTSSDGSATNSPSASGMMPDSTNTPGTNNFPMTATNQPPGTNVSGTN